MAGEQDVGGISLGLSLDTSGWSTGIAKAKAELEAALKDLQSVLTPRQEAVLVSSGTLE